MEESERENTKKIRSQEDDLILFQLAGLYLAPKLKINFEERRGGDRGGGLDLKREDRPGGNVGSPSQWQQSYFMSGPI